MQRIIAYFVSVWLVFLGLIGMSPDKNKAYYEYNNLYFGWNENQKIDMYIPKNAGDKMPLFVFIHGGGWSSGDEDSEHSAMESYVQKYGIAAISVGYRLEKRKGKYHCDDMLSDITDGISLAIETAEKKKGVEFTSMAVLGGSAGGHLSLLYAYSQTNNAPLPIKFAVSYAGPTNLVNEGYYDAHGSLTKDMAYYIIGELCDVDLTDENLHSESTVNQLLRYSPITYASENSVPTILVHGMVDSVVPYSDSVLLSERLTDLGVENYLFSHPQGDHGSGYTPEISAQGEAKIEEFINNYLK